MYRILTNLDRRWVFLAMLIAVTVPILAQWRFPEVPTDRTYEVFNVIENLPEGSTILMAFDYDPASQGELQPMASAFTRHAAEKKHKMIFMTLWPQGPPMIERSLKILRKEYPSYQYGRDYVNLGFRAGLEGVIKSVVADLPREFARDARGKSIAKLPLTKDMANIQSVALIINVSAGDPGSKQWVQFAASPHKIPMVSGTTGVQAPSLYPYLPDQLNGVLGAIKAAAEYEAVINEEYPKLKENEATTEGLRRMAPQVVAHMLMVFLILAGNAIYFYGRWQGVTA